MVISGACPKELLYQYFDDEFRMSGDASMLLMMLMIMMMMMMILHHRKFSFSFSNAD